MLPAQDDHDIYPLLNQRTSSVDLCLATPPGTYIDAPIPPSKTGRRHPSDSGFDLDRLPPHILPSKVVPEGDHASVALHTTTTDYNAEPPSPFNLGPDQRPTSPTPPSTPISLYPSWHHPTPSKPPPSRVQYQLDLLAQEARRLAYQKLRADNDL